MKLVLQRLVGDFTAVLRIGVLEHGAGKVLDLVLGELHSVLLDAMSYDIVELLVLDQSVTW